MSNGVLDCIETEMKRIDEVIDGICESGNRELTEMCHYVLNNHGKRLRPAMAVLSYRCLGGEDVESIARIAAAVEVIHNATLIHDDINDEGELRRGAKALYREYSLGKSIVAGDYLYAMGFRLIGATSPTIVDFVIDAAVGLAGGEFDQKDYEHNVAVDEAEYIKIIGGKTARLFQASARCGAYHAGPEDFGDIQALGDYAYHAGHAFQVVDDLLDVIGDGDVTGKGTGNDILEGKPTIPTIYAMDDPEFGPRVREIFENPRSTREDSDEAVRLIRNTDAIERSFALADRFADMAKSDIAGLPESQYKDSLIGLVDYIVKRDR